MLALGATGELLSHGARGGASRGPEVDRRGGYRLLRRRQHGELDQRDSELEPSRRHANRLLALLVALMVYPLAYRLALRESLGASVYPTASVL